MDMSATLQEQVQNAMNARSALRIHGGGSKHFMGHTTQGDALEVSAHRGIVEYDPCELVLTARTGTPLSEIEAALAKEGQMLPFEPPHFSAAATLGGTIACGVSGPRRPYAGAARDFVLGCKLLNGKAELLRFGGQVMKNVAGYDVSRLMVGAQGTLGVLLEVSLKVLPRPAASLTVIQECPVDEGIARMSRLLSQPVPVDAACYHAGHCYLRLAGSTEAVKHAHDLLGGEVVEKADHFWHSLREHELPFFTSAKPLYRIMVKPATPHLPISGTWLLDWGGAQRWLVSDEPLSVICTQVEKVGGHVSAWRNTTEAGPAPVAAPLFKLHQRLKVSFDPHHIFNPGRLYAGL